MLVKAGAVSRLADLDSSLAVGARVRRQRHQRPSRADAHGCVIDGGAADLCGRGLPAPVLGDAHAGHVASGAVGNEQRTRAGLTLDPRPGPRGLCDKRPPVAQPPAARGSVAVSEAHPRARSCPVVQAGRRQRAVAAHVEAPGQRGITAGLRLGDEHLQPVEAVAQPVGRRQRGRPAGPGPGDQRLADQAPVEPDSRRPRAPDQRLASGTGDDVDPQAGRVGAAQSHAQEAVAAAQEEEQAGVPLFGLPAALGDDGEVVASIAQAVGPAQRADQRPALDAQAPRHVARAELHACLRADALAYDYPHRRARHQGTTVRCCDQLRRAHGGARSGGARGCPRLACHGDHEHHEYVCRPSTQPYRRGSSVVASGSHEKASYVARSGPTTQFWTLLDRAQHTCTSKIGWLGVGTPRSVAIDGANERDELSGVWRVPVSERPLLSALRGPRTASADR